MAPEKVNLREKLALFSDHFAPRVVATLNDYNVMLVKVRGEFVWHSHPETDDLFLVLDGQLAIDLRDRTVLLETGELFVVPARRRAPAPGGGGGACRPDRAAGDGEHVRRSSERADDRGAADPTRWNTSLSGNGCSGGSRCTQPPPHGDPSLETVTSVSGTSAEMVTAGDPRYCPPPAVGDSRA
jgi:hypothetical protein